MAGQRRLAVSPANSRPTSMVDLPGQLEAVFNEWPSRSYNEDDIPIVSGSDIPDVLLLWSQQYNNSIPLLDMDDPSVKQIFETEHIRNFQLTPDQVYRLVTGLLETMGGGRAPRDLDDAEVSMLMSSSSSDDELPPPVLRKAPIPSQIPLPASASSEGSSPNDVAPDAKGQGYGVFGEGIAQSTPAKGRSVSTHGQQLQQFQFPSPEKGSSAAQATLARLRTTSNPETPPKKPKQGHKVYESRGDVPSAPSSWRHQKPAAPARRRGSLSRSSSHAESDTEDTFGSHRAPSNPASPRSAASILSPNMLLQELDSFPMSRGHSLHASLSAPLQGDFYHDPTSDPRLQEGDSIMELDMDSFHDMEATFASNPDAMPGDISITRLYAYIRTCSRLMNQAIQKAQDAEAEMKKSERDRMVLSDDLDDAKMQAAHLKRETENLLQQINTLNQSITASELNAANKDHELRRIHDRLHDRDRELQHARASIDTLKHTVALKDDEIARLKESEQELHSQLAEEEQNVQNLQAKHTNDLKELRLKIQESDEHAMDLREEIKGLMHEKDAETNKVQSAEAELIAFRAVQAESSKKTRLSSNKSPLASELVEETDEGTMVDDEQSTAEDTDADNETFVTHTVITRRKQPRKSAGKATLPSVHTEIEQHRIFAEVAIQAEPLELSATEGIQTDAPPKVVDMQTETEPVALVAPDEPFPSTSLLSTGGRKATQAETELERKWLFKWHEHAVVPVEGLAKGVTDDAVAEWEALKLETGRGCTVIDQLMERSIKVGLRPGSKRSAVAAPESDTEVEEGSDLRKRRKTAKETAAVVEGTKTKLTIPPIIHQIIRKIYPRYNNELDTYLTHIPTLESLKSVTLNRTTLLTLLIMLLFYTFLILHWAAVLNPAAYYPGLSYRDRALWTSYHQYAYHRRYGAPRMARTSPVSEPFTTAWYKVVDWATS